MARNTRRETRPEAVDFRRFTLMCRLRTHVITDEADFVPAGTPVKVMGWAGNSAGDVARSGGVALPVYPKVEVRTSAYMYSDTHDCDTGAASTGCGLYLSVDPDNLVFDDVQEDWPLD